MAQESRTAKSLKNAEVSFIYYALNLLVGFWSRKVFYDYLGSEVLGLDTTASTMLSFLNLAELGVGSAIAYFLYQPMFDKDTLTINEIVALQGWIYRRVAAVIMVAAAILMCFFPLIFKDIKLPMWYPYATFSVLLFDALLGYFINYRQCVLNADQKGYKVTRVTSGAALVFKIILILLLPVVSAPFLFYLGTNFLGAVFGCLWLNYILKKEYPWLHKAELSGKELLKKYPEVLKKTSQLFIHRIATFVVLRAAPLIMYAYSSLTSIAYYGNYTTIIGRAEQILGMVFGSTGAAVGNLIASHDNKHIMEVFWELNDSRLFMSTAFIIAITLFTEPFISVWLSPNYLLGKNVLYIISLSSWLVLNRTTVDSFRMGYGIFQDVWAPIAEGIINLFFSILLGYYFGIAGVLMGGVINNLIMVYCWRPYYLFKVGFHLPAMRCYFVPQIHRYLLAFGLFVVFVKLNDMLKPDHINGFVNVFLYGLVESSIVMPITYITFYFTTIGTRRFQKRMITLVKNKFK